MTIQANVLRRVSPGDLVWRTKDPSLESRLRASYDGLAAVNMRRRPVRASVAGVVGSPLKLTLTLPEPSSVSNTTISVSAASQLSLAAASSRPMTREDVARALGQQLGETTLVLEDGGLDVTGLDLAAGGWKSLGAVGRRGTLTS